MQIINQFTNTEAETQMKVEIVKLRNWKTIRRQQLLSPGFLKYITKKIKLLVIKSKV